MNQEKQNKGDDFLTTFLSGFFIIILILGIASCLAP